MKSKQIIDERVIDTFLLELGPALDASAADFGAQIAAGIPSERESIERPIETVVDGYRVGESQTVEAIERLAGMLADELSGSE